MKKMKIPAVNIQCRCINNHATCHKTYIVYIHNLLLFIITPCSSIYIFTPKSDILLETIVDKISIYGLALDLNKF